MVRIISANIPIAVGTFDCETWVALPTVSLVGTFDCEGT